MAVLLSGRIAGPRMKVLLVDHGAFERRAAFWNVHPAPVTGRSCSDTLRRLWISEAANPPRRPFDVGL